MSLEQLVEAWGLEWNVFVEALEELDREAFVALLGRAKRLAAAAARVKTPNLFESVVLSILVEHQRELSELQGRLLPVEQKMCPRCSRAAPIEEFFKGGSVEDGVGILCSFCREALCFVDEKEHGYFFS